MVPQLVDTGFQVLFHSPPGVLFTFPSQYYALSVTKSYLALGGGPPCFPQGFSCLVVLWILPAALGFRLRGLHPLRPAFPKPFHYPSGWPSGSPKPRGARAAVWAPPLSLAATQGIDFSFFSSGYLDVSVPQVPPAWLCVRHAVAGVSPAGSPHSDVCGSMGVCPSPQLFAAYHVFHRRLVPRHPPCALISLTMAPPAMLAAHIALWAADPCRQCRSFNLLIKTKMFIHYGLMSCHRMSPPQWRLHPIISFNMQFSRYMRSNCN